MKRITLFSVSAVLLLTGTASANLTVLEYVPGEKVTLDDVTGKYWYWKLNDFVLMTYDQQLLAIGNIGPTYGGIEGDWHMASLLEMQPLWTNSGTDIMAAFGSPTGTGWGTVELGRFDEVRIGTPGFHNATGMIGVWWPLVDLIVEDDWSIDHLGAWVTTDAVVIPAPPSVLLATTGSLFLLGAKLRGRWRRR